MQGYLLDTHTLLWLLAKPEKLGKTAKAIIENSDNRLYYSPLSLCEIAIKISIGKLVLVDNWQTLYQQQFIDNDIHPINQSWHDAQILQQLPFHHKDPFDRMLISCAMANNLGFISADSHCALYELPVIW